jgi:DNA-directed RNA polymerase specialized sigma24 family protein
MSDSVVDDETPAERSEHLGSDEVGAAIDSLSAAEKLRLLSIERLYLGGTGYGPNELLQEAMCRALMGERKCPRSLSFFAFMVGTMRGIAYHEREKRLREPPLPSKPRNDDDEDDAEFEVVDTGPDPEQLLLSQEAVAVIQRHFDGDERAQMVLLGWTGDLRGQDLREFVGVDQAELDYVIKRIRRLMKKNYPAGCIP